MESKSTQSQVFDEYHLEVLKDVLPNQRVTSQSSLNGIIVDFVLSNRNSNYKGSDYFVDVNNKEFIHFSTLEKAKEILASNKLRLYDLNYPDDPQELIFIMKRLCIDYNKEEALKFKSTLYSISFCSFPLDTEIEHNMWRLYGNDGKGVGLVLSFENNCEQWEDFNFSQIHYNEDNKIQKIGDAIENHNQYFQKLNKGKYTNNIKEEDALNLLLSLFAFHKHSIYGIEKEYRLLYRENSSEKSKVELGRTFTFNKSNQLSSYINLVLDKNKGILSKSVESKSYLPLIKIEKVILGYRYSEEEKYELEKAIRDVYYNNHECNPPIVEISELKKQYFK